MTEPAKFGIWCTVESGVTGRRGAWLKANGQVREFDTLDEAQAEATRLEAARADHPDAVFMYQPMLKRPL